MTDLPYIMFSKHSMSQNSKQAIYQYKHSYKVCKESPPIIFKYYTFVYSTLSIYGTKRMKNKIRLSCEFYLEELHVCGEI